MALIIDANTPTCCGGCFFLDYDTNERPRCFLCGADITENVREQTKLPICPIIGEIPDKHGRLIDADSLLPKSGYDPMMFKHKYDGDHRTQYDTLMGYEILGIVEDAPTIVEATE